MKLAAWFVVLSLGALTSSAHAFPLQAADTRNDGGQSVTLSWTAPPKPPAQWIIYRAEPGKPFAPIDTIGGDLVGYQDKTEGAHQVQNGTRPAMLSDGMGSRTTSTRIAIQIRPTR